MKITVITVCLNSSKTIERAIRSVISQDYDNVEYIIIDGGSTDGTVEIIKRYDKYISRWISLPDKGIFDAMNKGIAISSGDVIAFLNSDDWYVEHALKMVYEVFRRNDCDCVCCDNYQILKDGSVEYYDASKQQPDDIFKWMPYFHSAIFARNEMFCKEHNFDLNYKLAADYDWLLRIVIEKKAKLYYLHKPIFTFCYGGVSSVHHIEDAKEARKIAICHLPDDKRDYIKSINNRYYNMVVCALSKEQIQNYFNKILKLDSLIVLWGAGEMGIQCLTWLHNAEIPIAGIIDSNINFWGKKIQDVEIYSPQFLTNCRCNLIITPDKYHEEIHKQLIPFNDNLHVFELRKLWEDIALFYEQAIL